MSGDVTTVFLVQCVIHSPWLAKDTMYKHVCHCSLPGDSEAHSKALARARSLHVLQSAFA